MTKLVANTTVITSAVAAVAAALSLTALGSAGRTSDVPPARSDLHAGEDCTNRGDACADGTRCRPAVGTARHFLCLPVAKVGEACGPASAVCEEPAFCDHSQHCALGQAGLGQVCERHAECKAPLICPWAKHVCSSPGKTGQSCHTNPGGRSECEAGLGCDGIRCVARKPDGQACLADEECKTGACLQGGCARAALPSLAKRLPVVGN
jgi:hypothetical protein